MKLASKLVRAFISPCEVIEVNKDIGIYPIFKNARSSLEHWAMDNNLNVVRNNNIRNFTSIKIFLREPQERIISGIHTYIWQNNLENKLDQILVDIKNTKIINKHFVPQYYWILHLSKHFFGNVDIQNYSEVLKLTFRREGPWTDVKKKWAQLDLNTKEKIIKHIPKNYLEIDNHLYSKFLNKTINIGEIIKYFHALP